MAKGQKPAPALGSLPPPPLSGGEALHWFANAFGACQGSNRGLFLTDFTQEDLVTLESSIIRLRARGINPIVVSGEALYQQAEYLWQQAGSATTFGKALGDEREAELAECQLVIVQELAAPTKPQHLWYLYHYLLYPRALAGLATIFTTGLGYEEFIRLGSTCEDLEFGGRSVAWEKLLWLMEASLINLPLFAQTRADGLPPMLQAEYFLWMSLRERELGVEAQRVLHDYMLDMAIIDGDKKLAIECEVLNQPGIAERDSAQAKRNLMLLSEGWQLLRFSNREILNNYMDCAQAVEQVWQTGSKQTLVGHLTSGQTVVAQSVFSEKPQEDPFQQLATAHGGGPAVVFGGAGTGKTTCVAERVAYLVGHGANPERILVFFYSPEIGKVIRSQLGLLLDKSVSERVQLYTWQDLGLKILKENPQAIKRKAPIKIEPNSQKVIERVLAKAKKDFDPTRLELSGDLDEFTAASFISLYKARLITPKQAKAAASGVSEELMAKVYQAYEEQLLKANRIDRDDMVTHAVNCLIDRADLRARYQNQFDFVLVDEYQDATIAQDMLARLLAAPEDNLFFAGNENECIYESKGTTPELLAKISLRLPRTRCYFLPNNWRSQPDIVAAANQLETAHMQPLSLAPMVAARKQGITEGAIVGPLKMESETIEADWVGRQIQELFKQGTALQDIAVLYRYRRYGEVLEDVLTTHGVRFSATPRAEATLLPDEIGDMMAFLMLVVDPDGPKAKESFERACQLRTKEVDPKLSATIASFAEANNLSYLKAVEIYAEATADQSCRDLEQLVKVIRTMHKEALPPSESIALIRRTQRLGDYYSSVRLPASVKYEPLKKIFELEEQAREFKTVAEFLKNRQGNKPKVSTGDGAGDERVHLMTIREAKGLEFPVVFLVGLADGLFPAEGVADIKEERRLFYVGLTRAENKLYVSYPDAFEKFALKPSPFLFECGLLSEAEVASLAQLAVPAYKKISLDEPDDDSAAIAARSRTTPVPELKPLSAPATSVGTTSEQQVAGQAAVSPLVSIEPSAQPVVAPAAPPEPVPVQPNPAQPAGPEPAKPIAANAIGVPPATSAKPYLSQATVNALQQAQQEALKKAEYAQAAIVPENVVGGEKIAAAEADVVKSIAVSMPAELVSAQAVVEPAGLEEQAPPVVPEPASAEPGNLSEAASAQPVEFEPPPQLQPVGAPTVAPSSLEAPGQSQATSSVPVEPSSFEPSVELQATSVAPLESTSFEPSVQLPAASTPSIEPSTFQSTQAPTPANISAQSQSAAVEPIAETPQPRVRPGRALPVSKTPTESTAPEPEPAPQQSEASIWQEMTKGVFGVDKSPAAEVRTSEKKPRPVKPLAAKSEPEENVIPAVQEPVAQAPAQIESASTEETPAPAPAEPLTATPLPSHATAAVAPADPAIAQQPQPVIPDVVVAEAQAQVMNSAVNVTAKEITPPSAQDTAPQPPKPEAQLTPPGSIETAGLIEQTLAPTQSPISVPETAKKEVEPAVEQFIQAPPKKETIKSQPLVAPAVPAQLQAASAEEQKITLVDVTPATRATVTAEALAEEQKITLVDVTPATIATVTAEALAEEQKITLVDVTPATKAAAVESLAKPSAAAAEVLDPAPAAETINQLAAARLAAPPAPAQPSAPHEGQAAAFLAECPHCYTALEPQARFCGGCGFKLPVHIPACGRCHAPLPANAKFCGECGLKAG